jgi:hypothetical protein
MAWLVGTLAIGAGGALALSLSQGQGQDRAPAKVSPPAVAPQPRINLAKLPPFYRQMILSAQGGADWLGRLNDADGRFVYGLVPSLRTTLEGDHYLRQAGAAFALARAARFTHNERYAARARQAVVTLLLDTRTDPKDDQVRHTSLPSLILNRLGTAGMLVQAINELPSPAEDLLKKSEQLCTYIRRQQQVDGSLSYTDTLADGSRAGEPDPDGMIYYPGPALYGLMLSQRHKPAAWKTEVVRKALDFYLPWWRTHKSLALVPYQTAAYTEAYLLTKEKVFADAVNEMNDWLCELQYVQLDRNHPVWIGGFMRFIDGKPAAVAPEAGSGACAESLADACRVAHQNADLPRYKRYREALEQCLRFLTTLQYTEANTQHFADWYRPALLGGFHASHQDGNLRLDYTQHAVCALLHYVMYVAEIGGG